MLDRTPATATGTPERAAAPRVDLFLAPELGNTSYLVSDPDAGVAVVVDPMRDVGQYLDAAARLGVRITHTLETHCHNDFVSGGRELAREVGARVGAAESAGLAFDHLPLRADSQIPLGRWQVSVRPTPGHTPSHVSYVVGTPRRPLGFFSGGALMRGAIARTDLFGPDHAPGLALEAYRTLQVRLRDLPDDVALYPTHGGGSFCATGAPAGQTSTLGDERRTNPYLVTTDLMAFMARALHQTSHPAYYAEMTELNRTGARVAGRHLPPLRSLDADQVAEAQQRGAVVVDVRDGRSFDGGHLPGSLCVGIAGSFSAWVGWLVPRGRPIVLTGGSGGEHEEAQRQLFRIGFDDLLGALDGGVEAWRASGREVRQFESAEVAELATWILSGERVTVIDVRNEDEWARGHVPGALHVEVAEIPHHAHDLPPDAPVAVYCAGGYRSAIAASLLGQAGLGQVVHVDSPFGDWNRLNLTETVPG
ncbi:MAG: MBL fold metallo-hydrolase [Candidatus Dormibacteraceae bacterium]